MKIQARDQNNVFESGEMEKIRIEAIKLNRGIKGNRYSIRNFKTDTKNCETQLFGGNDIIYPK